MRKNKRDLYQEVTDRIISALERGALPWVKPWKANVPATGMPRNAISGRAYSGINVPLLWMAGFTDPRWLTYQQARKAGGHVRKGEKGTMAVFFKPLKVTRKDSDGRPVLDEDGNPKKDTIPLIKNFTLFNVEQCDDLPAKLTGTHEDHGPDWDPHAEAEALVEASGARVVHGGGKAYFAPVQDMIGMPPRKAFPKADSYYATLLHELTHWSGHASRLNRTFGGRFGDDDYAFEELVAEMGAAFLCAETGVTGEQRHAGYIQSWLRVLKGDKKAIFKAASLARQAAQYLTGMAAEEDDEAADEAAA